MLSRVIGDVQVEERRPRSWNEPRRKRLSFVRPKGHRKGKSDDWALVPAGQGGHGRRLPNDTETWDFKQWEAQRRFLEQDRQRVMLAQAHPLHGHPHGHPQGMIPPPPGWHPQHGMLPPMIEERVPRGSSHSGSSNSGDIMAIVDGSEDEDSDDSGSDVSVHRLHLHPLTIDKDHDRDELPHGIIKLKKGAGKKKGGKDKKKKAKKHDSSSDDDDSDDSAKGDFVKGFMAGRKASLSRGSPSPRRPRFERRFDDDWSDDSMDFRRRRRSRSRGRW